VIPLRRSVLFSILGFFVSAFRGRFGPQDRAAAIPEMKVLLENEHVRVQYHDVKVGERTALHSHPAYVAYVLNPYKARLVLPGGASKTVERRPGEVFFSGPLTHAVENIGDVPIHNLIVELKGLPAVQAT
jgi:quercetin dioxygenase-like cupin family protein